MSALCSTFSPSASAAIMPYSIPLWIILTKCPAPLVPQCSQPSSQVAGLPVRPGVRGAVSIPGASEADTVLVGQPLAARDVVAVVGVAAVDDDVARLHPLGELVDRVPGDITGWDH